MSVNVIEIFKLTTTAMNEIDNAGMTGKDKKQYVIKIVTKQVRDMYGQRGIEQLYLLDDIIEFLIFLSKHKEIIKFNCKVKKSLLECFKIHCCDGDDFECSDEEIQLDAFRTGNKASSTNTTRTNLP
jgi:hypothetical protein